MAYTFETYTILLIIVSSYILTVLGDPTHVCDQEGKEQWTSGKECSTFRACCQRECSDRDRSMEKAECSDRFYSVQGKKCTCGALGRAGEVSNTVIQERCEHRAKDKFFDREKCEEFRKCCRDSCAAQRRAVEEDTCDATFYEVKTKKCQCGSRRRSHYRRSDEDDYENRRENHYRSNERDRSRGGEQSNRVTQQDCERRANRKTSSSAKCGEFRKCCRETCREQGKSVAENECDGSFFDMRMKKCECRNTGGSRNRNNERSLGRRCIHRVESRSSSAREKCYDFKRCCDQECDGFATSRCDRFEFEDASCHCS